MARQLALSERYQIYALKKAGHSKADARKRLRVSPRLGPVAWALIDSLLA